MNSKPGRPVPHPAQAAEQVASNGSSPVFAENYPHLYGFLSESRKTENFHKTGSMTVFWEDGVFKVCLNDRPNFRSSFVSHGELAGALRVADRGIRSRGLKWRRKGYRGSEQPELFNRSGRYAE